MVNSNLPEINQTPIKLNVSPLTQGNVQKVDSPKVLEINKLKFNLRQVAQSSYDSGNLESSSKEVKANKDSQFKEGNIKPKPLKIIERYNSVNQQMNQLSKNKLVANEVKKPVFKSSTEAKSIEEFMGDSEDESIIHSDMALLEGQIQQNQPIEQVGIHVDKLYSNFVSGCK